MFNAFVHPFVNDALKPDPRVVSEKSKLRIGSPVDPRTEPQLPGDFALVANNHVKRSSIGNDKALVRVDIEDPFAARVLQREIAGGRKVIAPGEMVKLDWKTQGLLDRIIRRTRIDDDNLIDDADKRPQAILDEPRFVPDDQRRRQPAHSRLPQARGRAAHSESCGAARASPPILMRATDQKPES